jgi:hypothetical protein
MMEEISKSLERNKLIDREEVSFTVLAKLVVEAVQRIEKIEKRVYIGFDAMSFIATEVSVCGAGGDGYVTCACVHVV